MLVALGREGQGPPSDSHAGGRAVCPTLKAERGHVVQRLVGNRESGPPHEERVRDCWKPMGHPQSRHPTFLSLQLLKIRSGYRPSYVELTFSQHVRCECR